MLNLLHTGGIEISFIYTAHYHTHTHSHLINKKVVAFRKMPVFQVTESDIHCKDRHVANKELPSK